MTENYLRISFQLLGESVCIVMCLSVGSRYQRSEESTGRENLLNKYFAFAIKECGELKVNILL